MVVSEERPVSIESVQEQQEPHAVARRREHQEEAEVWNDRILPKDKPRTKICNLSRLGGWSKQASGRNFHS